MKHCLFSAGNRIIRFLNLACAPIVAGQLIAALPANAEIINLICKARENVAIWHVYWIDLAKGTMSHAAAFPEGVQTQGLVTWPVTITPESFRYTNSMGIGTIDRMTGVEMAPGTGGQERLMCSKGMLPFPATKF